MVSCVLNLVTIQTTSAINSATFRPEDGGTSQIEIYENGATVPTRTITIKSAALPFVSFDATGKYGKNILAGPYSSTYPVGNYSVQFKFDDVNEHTFVFEFYYSATDNITFSNPEGWSVVTIVDNTNANQRKTTLTAKGSKITADIKVTLSGMGSTTAQCWVDGVLQNNLYKKMAW